MSADELAISLMRAAQQQLAEIRQQSADMEQRTQAHIERMAGRAILKIGIVGGVSTVAVIVGAVVSITGYFAKLDVVIATQQVQVNGQRDDITRLQGACPACAVNAQHTADVASAKIEGHLSTDAPKAKK